MTGKRPALPKRFCNTAPSVVDEQGVQLVHLVAHTRGGFDRVTQWDSAAWLWGRIRRVFPDAVSNKLMPDHTHTHAPLDEFRMAAFRRVLQHHGRAFGTRWDIAPPQPVHTRAIARRTARYNFLNAVRAGLTTDPLLWPWSTFRDALGLVHDPWGGPATIRDVLGYTPGQMFWFTVDDGSCSDSARTPPGHTLANTGLAATFDAIASACASSLRCRPDDRYRRGHPCRATFVGLAAELGGSPRSSIATAVGVSVRALHSLRVRAEPSAIAAAKRCLVDPRLHAWRAPPFRQMPTFGS